MPDRKKIGFFDSAALGSQVILNPCKNKHCGYNFEYAETRAQDFGQQ